MPDAKPLHLRLSGALDRWPIAHRIAGWAVLALAVWIIVAQVRVVVRKQHGLPNIRHAILWEKNLFKQAAKNKNHVIAGELAAFYLMERVLEGAELHVGPALGGYQWHLEHVSRTRVVLADAIVPVPAEAWKDLADKATQRGTLAKRKLYLLVDPAVTTYVFVSTTDDSAAYVVPESVYRARVAARLPEVRSGANLSAP